MRFKFSFKYILLEITFILFFAEIFSVFAKDFIFWLAFFSILLLIWHHYIEYRLLRMLTDLDKIDSSNNSIGHLSQSLDYYQNKNKKDKLKTLKLLSKLSNQIQYHTDAIIICNKKGEIHWCNDSAQKLFSFYWNNKVSKNIHSIIFYPEFKDYFYAFTHNKKPLLLLINEQDYLQINLYQYNQYYLLISRNISQIVHLLNARQKFIANMNHELRTPLTVLQGYIEMLDSNYQSSMLPKAIETMQQQCQRMIILLQQLDLLAKVEASTNKNHQLINLSSLINEMQNSIKILNDNQHKIIFTITPDLYVYADKEQLYSAIINLINNAIKHAGKSCQINISLILISSNELIFSVKDTGIGIKSEHIPRLTERFYRGDSSREKTKGSGLGLAIVKHILQQHHSHLLIQSEQGKGSEFSFKLKIYNHNNK